MQNFRYTIVTTLDTHSTTYTNTFDAHICVFDDGGRVCVCVHAIVWYNGEQATFFDAHTQHTILQTHAHIHLHSLIHSHSICIQRDENARTPPTNCVLNGEKWNSSTTKKEKFSVTKLIRFVDDLCTHFIKFSFCGHLKCRVWIFFRLFGLKCTEKSNAKLHNFSSSCQKGPTH